MNFRNHCNLTANLPYALAVFLTVVGMSSAHGEATFIINVTDPPGVGFNDPEPRTPIGGNEGQTLGQQRLNVMQKAASLWGQLIDSPVVINVDASFPRLFCDANSAALGGARPGLIVGNFPSAPLTNIWYPIALANAFSAQDISPQNPDIVARFNNQLEGELACLGGRRWYYGLDNNSENGIDFLNVAMHELAHGLGSASFTDESTGQFPGSGNTVFPSVYDLYVKDLTQDQTWAEMTSDEQRRESAINTGNLVWIGPRGNEKAASLVEGTGSNGSVVLYAPNPVQPGSSISHWDTSVSPNVLMEPFITPDLMAADSVDLTTSLLADIGWTVAENLQLDCLHWSNITTSPAETLSFGIRAAGSSVTEKLIVTSNGSADLKILAVAENDALENPFSIAADNCSGKTLPRGKTCEIEVQVQFATNSSGSFEDSFEIQSNDPVTPNKVITVTGSVQQ